MILLLTTLFLIVIAFLVIRLYPSFGAAPKEERLSRIQQSPNYSNGQFQNPVKTKMQIDDVPFFKLIKEFLSNNENRIPQSPIAVLPIEKSSFHQDPSEVSICWLGHSTLLIKIDGKLILTDPVFSQRVSPFSFLGTKAFAYSENYSLEDLPEVDLVLISHDHYDHLDYQTIKKLSNKKVPFLTALGVGAHLERWGIAPERITELDWGETFWLTNQVSLTATPARHFSGRGLTNRFSTLWASWVISGSSKRLFFGADSGYFPGFKTLGGKYGPFDIAMLECGQYSPYWPFIHMSPEETLQAAADLKAQAVLPIHWAKYKLSIHPWTEPVERLLAASNQQQTTIATPSIGEIFTLDDTLPQKRWWAKEIN
ncbi:MBL fold metallo-hydrolase [uncultured Sunxiuqinia sp.]|uniref:MBL fold metallo-hydrolase n=1 Tax=uncultured Sunxiuqinia sp. TaxID=1573825 RepID=UPI002629C057|nr:MBL fold metallo-hydrolase [uncultured Sunxiuqinia sp.]